MLERVASVRGLRDRVADLEERVRLEVPEVDLQGRDPEIRRVLEMARRVAAFDAAVLLRGENGTGKGVLARALHAWSKRADGPFVTVNCPSLNPELLESDLFGHARGAFTGAVRDAANSTVKRITRTSPSAKMPRIVSRTRYIANTMNVTRCATCSRIPAGRA